MKAHVEERDGQYWVVSDRYLCLPQIPLKDKNMADRVANAINTAFTAGQDDVRAGLRDLLGCEPRGTERSTYFY